MSETNGVTNGRPAAGGRKTVCLGMPSYGELTAKAALGFYRASQCERYNLNLRTHGSSLLASNMNGLWAWALTEARRGECDYFAMQHSDIEPEEFWLDKLIEELEARELDVLGVVSPIKDQNGLTSIAAARADGDNWRPQGRLTMKEVYRLPETFTSDDLGRPLLINTGLWVCKLREDWAKKVHFTINDRICFDPKLGRYFAQVEPEDWFVSRLFHELGLRVGCTRKVELGHRGSVLFANSFPWGEQEYDRTYGERSLLDGLEPADWFPHEAAGWLTEREGRRLAELAADKVVLEVGSYCGRSTVCLAQRAKSVSAVDTLDGRGTDFPGDTLAAFNRNVRRYGVGDRVRLYRDAAESVLPNLPPVYDLAFVDASHDYESAARDAELAAAVLKPGGLLVFHDYLDPKDPGVTRAVDELLAAGGELLERCDSLAVVRPPDATSLTPAGGLGNG